MRFTAFIPALISLHTVSGIVVQVNPELITHMRSPEPGHSSFIEKANCMINLSDGKFVTVVETCDAVRRAIDDARR